MRRELARDDYAEFLRDGYFTRYTHILDVTDACLNVAKITQDESFQKRLLQIAPFWKNAYAEDGLMSSDSAYYEGDRYTYSFRLQRNMDERMRLCGGKKNFALFLDRFFGFQGERVKQITHIGAFEEIHRTHHHRFEGFNNECDMETPYVYIYADRHDRLCEIIHECVSRSFGEGKGGLPGNNDSGGLSSMLVWNTLGLFPVSGGGEFLIGSPQIEGARIALSSNAHLYIKVHRESPEEIYVKEVKWNGKRIEDYRISVSEIMKGGTLSFYME
jgi:putative alpha-1,2-mannosidase